MFKRILVANRGEIAVRVMRSAREMGIETIAVYHEVDKEALFVHYADYAYRLSGDSPKSAYLDIEQIINVAKKSCAEAIHPGYGFLSERAEFARAVTEAGIKFIGPLAESIEMMGSKTKAREIMIDAGVPVVPGTKEKITDIERAKEIASELGYPVLLKASAGGGGKGMRKVFESSELEPSFLAAQREALKAFGDDAVYLEKYIESPKHIEIQVLADEHGNYVYLGERDCSIQRRHQKVIEEAPSAVLDEDLRAAMGLVAVNAAKACNYHNAGTIEFLLDKNKNFYFLEMNTRLQVEHPVTEMVTGINLVKEQIKISWGEPLSFSQEDVKISGHAIECRIYAEDPFNNFMPDTGVINYHRQPAGYGVRVDSGVEAGSEVTIHFDPMLSKLITYGKDRIEAISRMEMALRNYRIKGVKTVIPFLLAVMQHPEFRYGWFDTGFIEHSFDFKTLEKMKSEHKEIIAAIAAYGLRMTQNAQKPAKSQPQVSKWKEKNLLLRRLV
ncbi:MAG: acetyl-CoA carboxylase biotin carboxylase subunit [Candidatus Kapabacteria bacterium]|nr:acetyl-CoA carboxylase biotin carboxylase subunit [Ignavibacteriota bacterium]MCW5883804.1 acetyl-CoA carboxylase biotin carboxylase subunit [Candidatus Kapabacteria bacterium]